jgi:Bacterial SH3 domain
MRIVIRLLVTALWLFAAASSSFAQEALLTETLKLRKAPSLSSQQTATLIKNSKVMLLEPTPTNGFYHVRATRNREGWVSAQGVKVLSTGAGDRKLVRRRASHEVSPRAPGESTVACQPDLASCPATGCAALNSPQALINQLKRTVPVGTTALLLGFDDFAHLQQQADSRVGEGKELAASDRAQLRGLAVRTGRVSEGDLVSLLGFLVGVPHASRGESVNCNLAGEANNDYHIPFSNDANNSDFQGIVLEMIPQDRPGAWTLGDLTQVETEHRLVMATGGLLYDNLHRVNADPNHPQGGEPRRFSLWEIHPITQFMVCTKMDSSCDPSHAGDWTPLGQPQ